MKIASSNQWSDLATRVKNNASWSDLSGVLVRYNGTGPQVINKGEEKVVKFYFEDSSSSDISYNTLTGVFTVLKNGIYFISAEIGGVLDGMLTTEIFVNDKEYQSNRSQTTNGTVAYCCCSTMAYLKVNETFCVKAYPTINNCEINTRAKGNIVACLVRPL